MSEIVERMNQFLEYHHRLKGDEKGEAQVFLDRLFQAFGHAGLKEAGANCEERIKGKDQKGTSFADLVWRVPGHSGVLIEMKKRGEKLEKHYMQAREYWVNMPDKVKYVILCNFDEFRIYDMLLQIDDPMDTVATADLPQRFTALNFLFPIEKDPLFENDLIAVTRGAADKVAEVFNSLVHGWGGYRKQADCLDREAAQRFTLQCVTALFAEDIDLLPRGLFTELIHDCIQEPDKWNSYDSFTALFQQMNNPKEAKGGRFKGVPYFNGGLFSRVEPVELTPDELRLLLNAANENWSKVKPPIFGALFEGSMDEKERHAFGAHFTSELDILKVVIPTIVRPWRERIDSATTYKELSIIRRELFEFQVLDPSCGSGNFLYVAYRELKRLEMQLITKVHENFGMRLKQIVGASTVVSTHHFHGIDIKPFAVELAKLVMMLAKKLALDEARSWFHAHEVPQAFEFEQALPLDNLDKNIVCDDALFCKWPKAQAIIGNPPYQSKNKMQQELGADYVAKVRAHYSKVPGRADYCVYWFHRAHDEMKKGDRAGLVGTNTIRQNYSREGSLDHIVNNGGTITEAVSTQVWSGDAVVHVSIVNWLKGKEKGRKKLHFQIGDNRNSPWEVLELPEINSSLSKTIDVSKAAKLAINSESKTCFQGQTHGHEGFLLPNEDAEKEIADNPDSNDVLFPYLTADEMLGRIDSLPTRHVIDFQPRDVLQASKYKAPFARVKAMVLPTREKAARKEEERNAKVLAENPKARVNRHHRNFLNSWWLLSYPRSEMVARIKELSRFAVCGQVTKRPIFDFIDPGINPNAALMVFTFEDDYSFGILQSAIHWAWFVARCSTLKGDFRYTSNSVYDTFPWPQAPTMANVRKVAKAAVALRELRRKIMADNGLSLRDLYRTLETPGKNPLRDAHERLDKAVRAAYRMRANEDPLAFLLKLNLDIFNQVFATKKLTAPGLPPCVTDPSEFITDDCVKMPE